MIQLRRLKRTPLAFVLFIFALGLVSTEAWSQTKRIRPAAEHIIVKCRKLIDPAKGTSIDQAFIEINNGKILRIGKSAELGAAPVSDVKIIDAADKFVIPGLIDTHGHLFGGVTARSTTADMLPAFYLAAGVTTVRTPGSMEPEGDMGLRYRIDSGRFLGPRYFLSGPYIEADPVTVAWMNPVKTPEEVRLNIEQWIARGATSVKLYAAMSGDLLKTAIDFGHAHGVKVIAHIGAVTYREAIMAGIDELFHGILAMPDIEPPGLNKLPPLDRYNWYPGLDLGNSPARDLLKLAARSRVVMTPTADVIEPLDPVKNDLEGQKKYYTPDALALLEKRLAKPIFPNGAVIMEKNKQFIKMAFDEGCILSTGTDRVDFGLLPGYSLWREMEIFAEAGLKPMDVLKAATFNGAFAIGRSDMLGALQEGYLADFVILDADPLVNVSNVRHVFRVVKDGVVYEPETLLKPLVGKFH